MSVAIKVPVIKEMMTVFNMKDNMFTSPSDKGILEMQLIGSNFDNAAKNTAISDTVLSKTADKIQRQLIDAGLDEAPKRLSDLMPFFLEQLENAKAQGSGNEAAIKKAVDEGVKSQVSKAVQAATEKLKSQLLPDVEAAKKEADGLRVQLADRVDNDFFNGFLQGETVVKNLNFATDKPQIAEKQRKIAIRELKEFVSENNLTIKDGKLIDENGIPYAVKGVEVPLEDVFKPILANSGFWNETPTLERVPIKATDGNGKQDATDDWDAIKTAEM
jgi:hypothetical protein